MVAALCAFWPNVSGCWSSVSVTNVATQAWPGFRHPAGPALSVNERQRAGLQGIGVERGGPGDAKTLFRRCPTPREVDPASAGPAREVLDPGPASATAAIRVFLLGIT